MKSDQQLLKKWNKTKQKKKNLDADSRWNCAGRMNSISDLTRFESKRQRESGTLQYIKNWLSYWLYNPTDFCRVFTFIVDWRIAIELKFSCLPSFVDVILFCQFVIFTFQNCGLLFTNACNWAYSIDIKLIMYTMMGFIFRQFLFLFRVVLSEKQCVIRRETGLIASRETRNVVIPLKKKKTRLLLISK